MFYFSVKQADACVEYLKPLHMCKMRERFIANSFPLLSTLFITFSDANCLLFHTPHKNTLAKRRESRNSKCSLLWKGSHKKKSRRSKAHMFLLSILRPRASHTIAYFIKKAFNREDFFKLRIFSVLLSNFLAFFLNCKNYNTSAWFFQSLQAYI